ncbi:MAG: ribosomal protein S18-alanine N-acetyltransferase [Desulfobacca sp.]|uniref:ribosomal protein S18-alanine N-acetyltransferase n=1 Tax=Desulfobacca sp. TaxID=2067990 RepID=UPI00404A1660
MPANSCRKNKAVPLPLVLAGATPADLEAIVKIERQSFSSPWPAQFFAAELSQPHSTTLVARDPAAGRVSGYIIFWIIIDELHILNLAVHPACRRRGIARRLLREALQRAAERRCRTAWLEVRPSNTAALSLYQSLGFRQITTRKRYYDDTGEDALILSRELSEVVEKVP